ncbi:tetratricopeptide repeat protein [Subdoligranulum variabile]|nr:tetratricopeptide repeat protein [Subdoligranulum variabile]UWP68289.1 tetratricopeptide repeat protein [Subdoligranulum variabile]
MYQVIKLDGFLEEVADVTEGPYARKFCFFLGAGASITSGIPAATKLVDLWDEKIRTRFPAEEYEQWKNEKEIDENNKYNHYSDYYEKQFSSNPVDGYNFLEKKMKEASPSGGYACLAFLLTQTPHKVVVTTNFDRLTEDAVTLYAHEFSLVVGHVAMAHYITSDVARPTVVKIHHDLLLDPKSKNADLQQLDERWQKALSEIFSKYHPIFIGFAGNDPDVMDYLIDNADKFQKGNEWKRPYWTVYGTEPPKGKVKDFLNKSGAFLIHNNGFDDMMARLALALNVKIPTEGDYQEEAEKQYNKLQDAFAKVQEGSKTSPGDSMKDSSTTSDNNPKDAPIPPRKENASPQDLPETEIDSPPQSDQDTSDSTLYLRALVLHNDKHYKESLALLQELIQKNPNNARYHYSCGVTLHEMGRYEEALTEKQKALELEPDNARYHDSRGVTLHEMGRYKEALAEKQKALELESDNARYHDSCGVTLDEMGRYEEALAESRKALELEPDNARYHDSCGVTLHAMGRYEEALAESRKALELEPDNARYHNNCGVTLHAMGWYEEALAEKQKALELEPNNAWYHDSCGVTLDEMGQYEEALAEKHKALKLEPDNARYHDNCSVTLHAMGRYKEALAESRKALELEPDNARYHDSCGMTLYAMELYKEAVAAFKKAIELNPKNAIYYRNLSQTYKKMGLEKEAAQAEEKAKQLQGNPSTG